MKPKQLLDGNFNLSDLSPEELEELREVFKRYGELTTKENTK